MATSDPTCASRVCPIFQQGLFDAIRVCSTENSSKPTHQRSNPTLEGPIPHLGTSWSSRVTSVRHRASPSATLGRHQRPSPSVTSATRTHHQHTRARHPRTPRPSSAHARARHQRTPAPVTSARPCPLAPVTVLDRARARPSLHPNTLLRVPPSHPTLKHFPDSFLVFRG